MGIVDYTQHNFSFIAAKENIIRIFNNALYAKVGTAVTNTKFSDKPIFILRDCSINFIMLGNLFFLSDKEPLIFYSIRNYDPDSVFN